MKHLFFVWSLLFILIGCAGTQHSPVGFMGQAPGLFTYTDNPMYIGSGSSEKKNKGEACAYSILGLFNWGNASINQAKKAGNISSVSYVDGKSLSILGIYAHYCSVAYGS